VAPKPGNHKKVLVIGGGIAGIQASIDLANLGFPVVLVEREPSLGGRMAQLDKTFPTNDCSMCILAPKMIECFGHEKIQVMTCSEVVDLKGKPGRFRAKILSRSRFVDEARCTGCGDCAKVCPVDLPGEFDQGLGVRNAIYKPFPQAVPNIYLIGRRGAAPCTAACPAGIEAQGYVALVSKGKFREALDLIRKRIPFAGVCGRICPHPCEAECNRKEVDSAVSIRVLKRFVADAEMKADGLNLPAAGKRRPEKVAVVGAGPGGLTAAYHLALLGYPVTVFEALPRAGGMLLTGVPAFRLPREILEYEIDLVRKLGVTIRTNTRIGTDITLKELRRQGFKAVFIATGAHADIPLQIPGEDLKGVHPAIAFLRAVNMEMGKRKKIKAAGRMVVIGGGNAAMDSARTALRLGFREVTIAYRRSRREMPAYAEEVEAALAEGIRILFLTAPLEILGKGGKVRGIRCIKMELGAPDASGRRRPVPIEGSEFVLDADAVVPAIGQRPQPDFAAGEKKLALATGGTIVADAETQATSLPGVFAGGDAVTGPANAIDAMGAGIRAALAIDRYLQAQAVAVEAEKEKPVRPEDLALSLVEKIERVTPAALQASARAGNFKEVEKEIAAESAVSEAARCLSCGGCSLCLECVKACQAKAIDHGMKDRVVALDDIGACIVATGYRLFDVGSLEEYGFGRVKNVVTALQFERMISASGPTGGHLKRPSDGRSPRLIGFIQCVGSRDIRHSRYCSAVCCMHATKEAILANEHDRDCRAKIFYMDLRAFGKGFQDYVRRAEREYGVEYVRARPGKVTENPENGNPILWYEDTARREVRREELDLVILCQAMSVRENNEVVARVAGVELDEFGFIKTPHSHVSPVDTTRPGVFACGYCQSPQDIPDSVVQSSSAASRVAEFIKAMGGSHE
jgi:heterodisulfide reductase subunit A-like polyferredoxin